jgi:5-methylcytosine-specific restriction enzyme subunit McrC
MTRSPISIDLAEWSSVAATDSRSPLAGVFLEGTDVQNIAQQLTAARMLVIRELREGLSMASTFYVGRIALGNIQITIHPKISGTPLVHLLQYAYGLRDLHISTMVHYESEERAFQDILVAQLIAEASELVARGLHRRYVRTDTVLASPRGRIDLQRIIKQGGVIQATIPCTYYPRLEDCLINQVLLQGLHLAALLTSESSLRIHLYRLMSLLEESVSSIRLDFSILKKLHREMDRLTTAYRPAITIIELLLAGEGIALDEDQRKIHLPGFLFNMNLFFQALLSRFLNEYLIDCEIRDQYKIKGMMSYDPHHNPRRRRAPTPRPDYVILQQGKVISILDAKYRDLWEHNLPSHMLYQLAIYALSQPQGVHATILYPTVQVEAREARIVLHDPVYGTGQGHVVLRPVNLLTLEKLLVNLEKKIHAEIERERASFARWLAFGEEK